MTKPMAPGGPMRQAAVATVAAAASPPQTRDNTTGCGPVSAPSQAASVIPSPTPAITPARRR
jgi:hypothetical protein